ncbi:uncharacterized protein BDFB_010444, partial [Asbolus verrucosus]
MFKVQRIKRILIFQLIALSLIALGSARPPQREDGLSTPPNYSPNPYELEQNRAARYEFSSNIEDHIQDQNQQRSEIRNGLNVEGSYSYSDGFYRRTVYYEADDKGFRVTKQDIEPLANGPKINLSGTALVDNAAHGTHIKYKVQ